MSNKTRLDVLLTERGLLDSRQKAQATIMSGIVFVNGQRVDKVGTAVSNDALIEIRGTTLPYVSRGGLKLEKAVAHFDLYKRQDLRRHRCFYRRLYGLYAAKRRKEGICRGCGLRAAGLEAAQ